MPNDTVPAAATGLPMLTTDAAIANLRDGPVAHFLKTGQTIDFTIASPSKTPSRWDRLLQHIECGGSFADLPGDLR